jgi:hypothetical protein
LGLSICEDENDDLYWYGRANLAAALVVALAVNSNIISTVGDFWSHLLSFWGNIGWYNS